MPKNIMETEDYLSRIPFTIVFIDSLHNGFRGGNQKINEHIGRIPVTLPRLHQSKFAEKIPEMAAHCCNMRAVVHNTDSLVKYELYYIVRSDVFCSGEKMWTFINGPDDLAVVVSQPRNNRGILPNC